MKKEVNCLNCNKTVILTDDESIKKFAERKNICSGCAKTQELTHLIKKRQRTQTDTSNKVIEEKTYDFKKEYEQFLEIRKKYFDLLNGSTGKTKDSIHGKIADFYGVDFWGLLNENVIEPFNEFFNMGENPEDNPFENYEKLTEFISKYKKSLPEEKT